MTPSASTARSSKFRTTRDLAPLLALFTLLGALTASGCAAESSNPCQAAEDHLVSCGATVPDGFGASCVADEAAQITKADCDELAALTSSTAAGAKADGTWYTFGLLGREDGDPCTLSAQCSGDLICRTYINGNMCGPPIQSGGRCFLKNDDCKTRCKSNGSLESSLLSIGTCE